MVIITTILVTSAVLVSGGVPVWFHRTISDYCRYRTILRDAYYTNPDVPDDFDEEEDDAELARVPPNVEVDTSNSSIESPPQEIDISSPGVHEFWASAREEWVGLFPRATGVAAGRVPVVANENCDMAVEDDESSIANTEGSGKKIPAERDQYAIDRSTYPRWRLYAKKKVKRKPRVVVKYLARARLQFGIPTEGPANRASIRVFVRKEMEKDNVRLSDRLKYINQIIELCFVPSEYDLEAMAIKSAPHVVSNKRVFGWLGGKAQE
jgi:hypothetical protein